MFYLNKINDHLQYVIFTVSFSFSTEVFTKILQLQIHLSMKINYKIVTFSVHIVVKVVE